MIVNNQALLDEMNNVVAIRTINLQRNFGNVAAVKDFSISVNRGEMFGIVGPDSSGKSTAIRVLCGLLKPTSGSASILDHDLVKDSKYIKGRIGYLSQEFILYGDLSVDENIEFFAQLHNVRNFKIRRDELLKFTRLEPFRNRLGQHLSGGMKKKLALACTLIHTPEIIFLDEPSTGVDPVSRGEFWNILSEILQQGVTIVMTTPYLDEAERCDRICLMYQGMSVVIDTPERIKSSMPGKVYDILCSNPQKAYLILRKYYSPLNIVLYGERLRLWTEIGDDDIIKAISIINSNLNEFARYQQSEPTFEDAFVALTGNRANLSSKDV